MTATIANTAIATAHRTACPRHGLCDDAVCPACQRPTYDLSSPRDRDELRTLRSLLTAKRKRTLVGIGFVAVFMWFWVMPMLTINVYAQFAPLVVGSVWALALHARGGAGQRLDDVLKRSPGV